MAVPNGNPEPEARAIPESQDMLETLQPADEDGPTPVEEDLEIDPTDGQPVIPPEEKPVEEEAAKPAADAPLAERLRASLPESVSAEEIDAIETELAEHKSYRELFEGVEDAHNAVDCREDLRLLAGDIHSGDFQRVWNNLPAANSARAVQSIREDFARVHPQAYAELEKSIYLDALQHLERKMDGYADKETARIGKLVTNVFGQEIMGEKDWRTLVEDPAIAEQRKKLEADRETMTQQILQRDWSTIWNGITQTFTYKIQSALRKAGIEPTDTKVNHAGNIAFGRIKADERFQTRMGRHHESAHRTGYYSPALASRLATDYDRRADKEIAAAVKSIAAEYGIGGKETVPERQPNRVPDGPVKSRQPAGEPKSSDHPLDKIDWDRQPAPGQDWSAIMRGDMEPVYLKN